MSRFAVDHVRRFGLIDRGVRVNLCNLLRSETPMCETRIAHFKTTVRRSTGERKQRSWRRSRQLLARRSSKRLDQRPSRPNAHAIPVEQFLLRHGSRIEAVLTLEVDVPRSWLRRSRKGLWSCTRDIPPDRIRRLFGFVELARTAG